MTSLMKEAAHRRKSCNGSAIYLAILYMCHKAAGKREVE